MGIVMPKAFKIGDTSKMRRHVQRDVAESAKGRRVSITIGERAFSDWVGSGLCYFGGACSAWPKTVIRKP